MNVVRLVAFVLIVALGMMSPGSRTVAAQQPPGQIAGGISPEALAQIEALIAEKDARTPVQQKIDSQLLYEQKMESGQPLGGGMWAIETDLPYAPDGHVIVDVQARAGSGVAARLPGLGFEVVFASADGSSLRVHLNIAEVETLAADPDVLFVQPRQDAMVSGQSMPNLIAPTGQGSRSSEGDVTHLAFAARGAFHIDGSGVRIGVLSNGVRSLAASQAAGDLGPVTVIGPPDPCPATSQCDEGTAMLEIIHDLVPGAQLFFASANISITSFADNIRALRAAGCDIIVDDVFYFVETPFQDGAPGPTPTNGGAVIQAVKDVTASGALYFSSAGNSGNVDAGTAGAWEGDFVDGGATAAPLPTANRVHDFGGQNFNLLTLVNTSGAPISVYWSDPLGASSNDYDLFRLNAAGTAVGAAATNVQNGTQDPIEQINQAAAPTGARIVVVKKASAEPRFLHLNTNRGRLSIPTSGTTHGHATANSAAAYAVAATPASGPFPQAFSAANHVETFSSDGPRHIFYNGDGTAITPGNVLASGGQVLQKPDITAADGVSVTGVGGFPSTFFGTSAAAPHAAAIAALMKAANSALTPAQIRNLLTTTSIDIETPGFDRDSGAGIIMARDAVIATGAPGTAFLAVETVASSDNPGNGNGVVEAGEGGRLTIALKNYGVVPATKISTTLTSPTTGITVGLPNMPAYPDLAPLAQASNSMPLLFTAASDLGCPAAAGFTFTANYTGGVGALTQPFTLSIGASIFTVTTNLDGTAPTASPGVVTATGVQNFRLNRQDSASVCGALKPPPPISAAGGPGARQFDSYTLTTCGNSNPSCASVTFSGPNSLNMFSAAYVPTFNPDDITQNYRADPALSSAGPLTYSFDLPAGSSTFAVDVHDVPVLPAPSGSAYTLSVAGACVGSCAPPNHPPVAKAKSVTVSANNMCVADASIDDGSSDPDGDVLTLVQMPPSPYPLGTTAVRLTATDPSGAFSQANGSVTVVDQTAATLSDPTAERIKLLPKMKKMFAYRIDYTAADNCGPVTTSLSVTVTDRKGHDDDDDRDHGRDKGKNDRDDRDGKQGDDKGKGKDKDDDGDKHDDHDVPDFVIIDNHHVWLRADQGHGGRIFTITVTAVDGAGNKSTASVKVKPPHDSD